MTAAMIPPYDRSLTDNRSHSEAQKRAQVKHSVKKGSRTVSFSSGFQVQVSLTEAAETWQACEDGGLGRGRAGGESENPPTLVQSLPSSW